MHVGYGYRVWGIGYGSSGSYYNMYRTLLLNAYWVSQYIIMINLLHNSHSNGNHGNHNDFCLPYSWFF